MKWINKHICIGFENEYSLVPYNNSENPKGIVAVSHTPIIEPLPMEEIAFAQKNCAIFTYTNRVRSRDPISFRTVPLKFAFSFPFLISLSKEYLEVRNLMEPSYHECIKKPFEIQHILSDGRYILLVGKNQILVMLPNSSEYCTKDPALLKDVCRNPLDKTLFVKYISNVLGEARNPFRQLLSEFSDRFVTKFQNPEEVDFVVVKKFLEISLRKLNQVILAHFKQFRRDTWKNLLFNTLQTIFYAKIYWLLFAMVTVKNRNQDMNAFEKTSKYKNVTLGMLGARRRFWLSKESLDDPPPKKSNPETDDSVDDKKDSSNNNSQSETNNSDDDISFLTYFEINLNHSNHSIFDGINDKKRPNNNTKHHSRGRKKSTHKFKDTVSPSLAPFFMNEETKLDIDADVELHSLIDPLTTSSKLIGIGRLKTDEMQNMFIKLPNIPKPFYILPNKQFSYHQAHLGISWQQKEHYYKIKFDEQYIYDDVVKQLSNFKNYGKNSSLKSDDLLDYFVLRAVSEELGEPDESSDELHWKIRGSKKYQPPDKSGDIAIITEEEAKGLDGELDSFDTYGRTSNFFFPSTPTTATASTSTSYSGSTSNQSHPLSKKSDFPSDSGINTPKSQMFPNEVTLTFDQRPPYYRAIKTLRKISHLKSPRDKLGCILQTFRDLIQAVVDFWEQYDREAVVGADDLVPIFSYVILKARIPKLFSEMNFIWEFARDVDMEGKYGYGFATFQIGVEIIARLDDTIWQMDEHENSKDANPKSITTNTSNGNGLIVEPPPSSVSDDRELAEAIHEKRDQLVYGRELHPLKSDEEDIL